MSTLSKNETSDLLSVFACAIQAQGQRARPGAVEDIERLWEKVGSAMKCQHDTDNDGDCQLCARSGGCALSKTLR